MCKKSSRALSGFSALSLKMPVRRLPRVSGYSSVGVLPEIVEKYALNRCRRALSHNVKHIVDFLHSIIEQTDRTRLSGGIGKGTVEVSIVFYFYKVVECMQKILARFKRLFRAFAQNACLMSFKAGQPIDEKSRSKRFGFLKCRQRFIFWN